ncbi:hypothetical protein FDT66_12085 [Polaribacter aestuariivivens]|uniref:Phosphoribosylpyrophosphate synthetase n=1 Tax=Polaribacter aestuariivivens TaxID=2304626 RepID=A0A5S3N1L4_9FLAO|nr:hypothetical protein [Polaribacter aestuariivivens]TMM29120.1 hypothetical protein FDT66_12085 [Polaribacter aestuariivivens]
MKSAKNELELIKKYEEKGYTESYRVENTNLIANREKTKYTPKDVKIVAEHRFEGMSNPSDMSILYVIETKDTKGTLVASYGAKANLEIATFFKEIPKENISEDKNIFM